MKSRALLAVVVLSTALASGGWLVERGLMGSRPSASDNARMFNQVLGHVSRDFVDTLPDTAVFRRAAEGLISELHDPHSSYLSPKVYTSLNERTTGRYAGIGAQVDIRDAWPTVMSPIPGGPAIAAGIEAGDRIVAVEDKPMHGMSIEEAQKALRGAPGSVVRVTIERAGLAVPLKFALTRNEIRIRSVQHATMLNDGIGYVALTIFSEESAPDLRRAIDSLRAAGMQTLIFDLRGDPGGLLDQGVGVADLFLNENQRIVSMHGRTPQSNRTISDNANQPWPNMPLIVLVDSGSASASEIVAGALQDHDRALLLGTATYGKGSAQNLFPLSDGGAAKLTTALWFTPSGRSINRRQPSADNSESDTATGPPPKYKTDAGRTVLGGGGITPDVLLPAATRTASDTAFDQALGKQIPLFRDALTDYALSVKASHQITSPNFVVTPAMRADLLKRMRARGLTMGDSTFAASSAIVDRLLGYEIARYTFGSDAEYARRIRDDRAIARAVEFARGATTQQQLLDRAKK